MDRCAVFVDAGYVLAEGGKLCCGSPSRRLLVVDAAGLVNHLCGMAREACGLPVLRTYWYDGARDGLATTSQQVIASLANVKLRLGRLSASMQQKGVDALIYRDLMTLARERAISDAVLVSGDEDLREGVRAAQDMGVRVTLVGISPTGQQFNQSRDLVREADEVRVLTRSDVATFITKRTPRSADAGHSSADPLRETKRAATDFATTRGNRASTADLVNLHADRPRIPRLLDVDLVQAVEHHIGTSLRGSDDLKRAARSAFWASVPTPPMGWTT